MKNREENGFQRLISRHPFHFFGKKLKRNGRASFEPTG